MLLIIKHLVSKIRYQLSLCVNPKNIINRVNLGLLYEQQNRYSKAIKHYNKAIELDNKYGFAYINLAIVYHKQGRQHEAIEHYNKAIALQPNLAYISVNLDNSLRDQEEYSLVIFYFQKTLDYPTN